MQSFGPYGPISNTPQQPGPGGYMPWQQGGKKPDAAYGAQANKDMAAFGALQNLGVAGQNAMGQYGMAQQNALVNSQIAQNNFMGQMGASYYNTLGQGMNALAGMNAAASQAGADSNKAAAVGGLGAGVVNAGMYNASMAPYTAGNMPNFNFGGFGGGFRASGPEGTIASGGYGRGGGGRPFNAPPAPPYVQGGGGGGVNPYQPFQQSLPVLKGMMQQMDNPNGMPNLARQDVNKAFGQTQANLMNPGIRDSLNGQMAMGYGALSNLYNQADYGFNTGSQFRPRYTPGRSAQFNY